MSTEIYDAFDRLQKHLDTVANGSFPMPEPIRVRGEGVSEDGLVEAAIEAGEVVELRIDPRANRQTMVEVSNSVKEAVNAALKAHLEEMVKAAQQRPDTSGLKADLADINYQAQQSLKNYLTGMQDLLHQAQDLAARQAAIQ